MIVTDHFLSPDDLADIGERIRTDQPVQYPEDAVADYIKLFEEGADRASKAYIFGCLATILVVASILVWLFVWGT